MLERRRKMEFVKLRQPFLLQVSFLLEKSDRQQGFRHLHLAFTVVTLPLEK